MTRPGPRSAASTVDESRPFSLERLVFFTDAVFAIAITLLAIDIRLPDIAGQVSQGEFNQSLIDLTPKIFSYVLSFAIIAIFWLAHWRRYDYVRGTSDGLATINMVLLGFVAIIPFPTSLLGEHGNQPAAVVLYAAVVSAAGIAGSLSWLYADWKGLTVHGHSRRWVFLTAGKGLVPPMVFLGSLPLLLIHPYAVEAAWVLIFPLQRLVVRTVRRVEEIERRRLVS